MIIIDEPECWEGCTDHDCPYVHRRTFRVREEDTGAMVGPFSTLHEAESHDWAHGAPREA